MKTILACLLGLMMALPIAAEPGALYKRTVAEPLATLYPKVYAALEAAHFWVVFEPDFAERMANFKDRWGDDYNRSGLSGARAMVACNIEWTNRVANVDPDLLALCPVHVSLYERDGHTTILLPRPSALAVGTAGEAVAAELERALIEALEQVGAGT